MQSARVSSNGRSVSGVRILQERMETNEALIAAREQLLYWLAECATARELGDLARIEQCERFIEQSELVIAALVQTEQRKP